ncbi:hypothetical protein [Cohnella nanjingensis]|uniref:Linear amide C-N hydrolase n=1 Tax=Cohnella nanjingensis TaxID=1387779 RepID=A0A7X0RSN4_9BACL|nr:hypothetical protein [Cohnella nanjingensis]MBB6672801.1 hypothetical protein [Cohnella nanjingensis]
MCTSFVVHGERTFIGMNFDISDRPIKLARHGEHQLIVRQQENGSYYPAFGLNRAGTFMNLQTVEPNEAGRYRRTKDAVHTMRLFEDVLGEKIRLSSLGDYLRMKAVVNVPNYSVHCLIAGMERQGYIVEPGRGNLALDEAEDPDVMVLTNCALTDGSAPVDERYETANRAIRLRKAAFDPAAGLAVLAETAQQEGDYPTQLSLVSVPEEGLMYFALRRRFDRIFVFRFDDDTIRTHAGFERACSWPVTKQGIDLADLDIFA